MNNRNQFQRTVINLICIVMGVSGILLIVHGLSGMLN